MRGIENQLARRHSFFRVLHAHVISAGLLSLFVIGDLNAIEWSINSNVYTYYEYNDNIFLTTRPHESVSNIVINPDIKFLAKERNWKTMLDARLISNNYSASNLDSNDQYYNLNGSYNNERDRYSIDAAYDLNSSLSTESDAFGISEVRINRTTTSISPSYSRMLTERLIVSLGYTSTESKYDDSANIWFVSYKVDIGSVSVVYNLTERDKFNASVQYTDYMGLNGLSEYQSLILRTGLSRQFTESFMADFQVGTSERDSISRLTNTIDFFGTTVTLIQENDLNNSGLVLDAGFELKTETGKVSGRISRDNVTSSYGGVNEVDKLSLGYNQSLSDRWGYALEGRYDKNESIISGTSFLDRNLLSIKTKVNYSLARNWKLSASWRYLEQEFTTQSQANVPRSNRLYIGMTYNFSEVSTF